MRCLVSTQSRAVYHLGMQPGTSLANWPPHFGPDQKEVKVADSYVGLATLNLSQTCLHEGCCLAEVERRHLHHSPGAEESPRLA